MLGNRTAVTRYETTATRDGVDVSVVVAVAIVDHGDNYDTAVVVVPAERGDSVPTVSLFGVTH